VREPADPDGGRHLVDAVEEKEEDAMLHPRHGVAHEGGGAHLRDPGDHEHAPRGASRWLARHAEGQCADDDPQRHPRQGHARKGRLQEEGDRPAAVAVGERPQRNEHHGRLRRRRDRRAARHEPQRPRDGSVRLDVRLRAQDEEEPRDAAQHDAGGGQRQPAQEDVDEPGH
jgi:hypothetical protein